MGILCHLDVVPTGEGWQHDPFGGEVVDGRIYGRGAMDDKGPAMAAVYAMKDILIPAESSINESASSSAVRKRLVIGWIWNITKSTKRFPPSAFFTPTRIFRLSMEKKAS